MIEISIKRKKCEWLIQLTSKITQIIGDSATGKSSLSKYCSSLESDLTHIKIHGVYGYSVETDIDGGKNLVYWVNNSKNKILIIDETRAKDVKTDAFRDAVKNNTSCYFIFTFREVLYKYNIDIDSIKEGITVENRTTYSNYTENSYKVNRRIEISDCVLEDAGQAFDWFKSLFNGNARLTTSNGASNFCNEVRCVLKNNDKANVLMLFDRISFGCYLNEYRQLIKMYRSRVFECSEYKCWEYLMLRTNAFRKNFKPYTVDESGFEEAYYENQLLDISRGKHSTIHHDGGYKLPICYTEACCKFKCNTKLCGAFLRGSDKFVALLDGTEFEFLLLMAKRA